MTKDKKRGLSKSRVMLGFQCEKALYLKTHSPDLAKAVDPATQLVFDYGTEVGEEAAKRFPGGIWIDKEAKDLFASIGKTKEAIEEGVNTLYEATFESDKTLVKCDILTRESSDEPFRLIEVKSTGSVKEDHVIDLAIQATVLLENDIKLKSHELMHLNKECKFPKLENLFIIEDLTKEVETILPAIKKEIFKMKELVNQDSIPDIDIGPHCKTPHPCSFKAHCWGEKNIPEFSIFNIPRLPSNKKWKLYQDGIVELKDLDAEGLNATQKKVLSSHLSGNREIDRNRLKTGIKDWEFPLYHLDFETIGPPIPRFEGVKPYEQIPFQFSLHIQKDPSGDFEHFEYLHTENTDPRHEVSKRLCGWIGETGSIVAYNAAFEKQCLEKLAKYSVEYRNELLQMSKRLVDPLPIIRSAVYDPGFKGSFSLKTVGPSIVGDEANYSNMRVGNGADAQVAFEVLVRGDLDSKERTDLEKSMIEYCTKDTLVMVKLCDWIFTEAGYQLKLL